MVKSKNSLVDILKQEYFSRKTVFISDDTYTPLICITCVLHHCPLVSSVNCTYNHYFIQRFKKFQGLLNPFSHIHVLRPGFGSVFVYLFEPIHGMFVGMCTGLILTFNLAFTLKELKGAILCFSGMYLNSLPQLDNFVSFSY